MELEFRIKKKMIWNWNEHNFNIIWRQGINQIVAHYIKCNHLFTAAYMDIIMNINIIQVDDNYLINNEIDNFYKVYFPVIIVNLSFNNESHIKNSVYHSMTTLFHNFRREFGSVILRAIQFSIANFKTCRILLIMHYFYIQKYK